MIEDKMEEFANEVANRVNLRLTRGLLALHNGLNTDVIADSIVRTHHTVIVETWIGWETIDKLRNGFLRAFDKGFSVTIYLLHPNSPNIGKRQMDMAPNDKFSGRDEVIRSLEKLASIRADWVNRQENNYEAEEQIKEIFVVYCYDSLPSLQVYKLQDRAIVGFYLNGGISNNGIQLEVSLEGQLGKDILRHIDDYTHVKKGRHIIPVDLGLAIEEQFDSIHLGCQLDETAKQLINLNNDEVTVFCDIVLNMLMERKRMGEIEKRKATMNELIERIKTDLINNLS